MRAHVRLSDVVNAPGWFRARGAAAASGEVFLQVFGFRLISSVQFDRDELYGLIHPLNFYSVR